SPLMNILPPGQQCNPWNFLLMKTEKFKDKVFLITGASSGIGEALTYSLSKLDAKIILTSRNQEALEKVKALCEGNPENIHTLSLDLAQKNEIELKANNALGKWGSVDYLIHNAGITARDLATNTSMMVNRS